ncbi:MAG TPA: conjugal transfer protein [Solirubrobacteraceae bacterium]|nr:conjugal transfer protein [Solirubrobacteraceae bacterium]
MPDATAPVAVSVTPRALWRLRLRRELPRRLLQAVAVCGLLASARFAVDPPVPVLVRAVATSSGQADRAAEGFAALFARRYLSWNAADPEAHRLALAPYLGPQMEPEAGFQPPQTGSQHVLWTQVVQARTSGAPGRTGGGVGGRYTVAVQTDASGLLYLSVAVSRAPSGALALSGYPAFVGPPPTAPAPAAAQLGEVQDASLATVVTRALRNYLAGTESELAADLAAGVRVPLPAAPLSLESLDSLDWEPGGGAVLALVHAQDRGGGRYALAYRLAVALLGGRWEISAIEVDQGQ